MTQRLRSRESGFTLVEIIASMVILGIGMVSIIALQTNAFRGGTEITTLQKQNRVALECAEQVLGVANTQGWDELTTLGRFGAAKCDNLTAQAGFTIPTVSFAAYTGSGCPTNYECNMVTVTASPTTGSGAVTFKFIVVNH